jgi:hypothetical protein
VLAFDLGNKGNGDRSTFGQAKEGQQAIKQERILTRIFDKASLAERKLLQFFICFGTGKKKACSEMGHRYLISLSLRKMAGY